MPQKPVLSDELCFDVEMPAKLRSTLLFLLGLCGPEHRSGPITFADLARRMQKGRANLYNHLSALRLYRGAVTVRYVNPGTIVLGFASWLFEADAPGESTSLDSVHKEEEELTLLNSLKDLLLLNAKSPQMTTRGLAPVKDLAPEVVDELLAAHVFRGLLPEIAGYGRSSEDLLALLAWAREDQPKKPAQLFMARLRHRGIAPDEYYEEACPVCGKHGGHAHDCYRRFEIPRLEGS